MLIRERSCKSKGFAFVCGECSTVGRSRQNIVEKKKATALSCAAVL